MPKTNSPEFTDHAQLLRHSVERVMLVESGQTSQAAVKAAVRSVDLGFY